MLSGTGISVKKGQTEGGFGDGRFGICSGLGALLWRIVAQRRELKVERWFAAMLQRVQDVLKCFKVILRAKEITLKCGWEQSITESCVWRVSTESPPESLSTQLLFLDPLHKPACLEWGLGANGPITELPNRPPAARKSVCSQSQEQCLLSLGQIHGSVLVSLKALKFHEKSLCVQFKCMNPGACPE